MKERLQEGLDKQKVQYKKNATRVLLEKWEGTFLWVGFVIDELLKKRTRTQVERAMHGLPIGLPAVYARMLQSIEPVDRENSKKLLTCVALAFKPLYLEAIADILDVQGSAVISEEQATLDAIAICAPMLQLRSKSVEFVHQSAPEYLLRDQADDDPILENFRITLERSHLYLAQRCLQSLSENTWLQHYYYMNWPKHAKHSHSLASSLLDQNVPFFEKNSPVRNFWWCRYRMNFPGLPKAVPNRMHMACFIGHEAWAKSILLEEQRSGKSLNDFVKEKCPRGWLAMNYAAEGASGHMIKLLLECTPHGGHAAEQFDFSLRQAVLSQCEEAVKLLLDCEADPNKSDVDGNSPLFHAMFRVTDPRSTAIFRLLNDHGADPGSMAARQSGRSLRQVNAPRVAQQAAAGVPYRCFDTIQILLDQGMDINIFNSNGETIIHIAVSERMIDSQKSHLVRFLSSAGANVDARTHFGETTLHATVEAGVGATSTIFGADFDARNLEAETPLHIAVR